MGDFNCDFNAPMFVDFESLRDEDHNDHQNAEAYFDVNHEEIPSDFAPDQGPAEKEASARSRSQQRGNLVDSWDEVLPDRKVNSGEKAVPAASVKETKEKVSSSSNSNYRDTPTRNALRQAVTNTIKEITNSPKMEVPRRRAVAARSAQSPLKRLNPDKPLSATAKPNHSTVNSSPARSRWQKVIRQMTPEIMKKARMDRQLRKMQQEKEHEEPSFKSQLATSKRLATITSAGGRSAAAATEEVGKVKAPTNPAPFKFATVARAKTTTVKPVVAAAEAEVDFAKMLRSYQNHPSNSKTNAAVCTKVQPFHLSGARKRFRSAEPSPGRKPFPAVDLTLAQKVQRFEKSTPDRFRSRPRFRSASPARPGTRRGRSSSSDRQLPTTTRPHAPNLLTRGRSRPVHAMSREQQEEAGLEEARRHQFKAREVNDGLKPTKWPTVEKKSSTVPEPFHFASSGALHHPKPVSEEPSRDFHAHPLNRRILEKAVGVPAAHPKPTIVPESPAFALKDRIKNRKRATDEEDENVAKAAEDKRVIYAKPVPQFGVPVVLQNPSKRATVAEPFSFDQRDHATLDRKEKKIQSVLEQEKREREFKAKPVPNYLKKPVNLPAKEVEAPTRAVPFDFKIDKRVEDRLQKWQRSVEEELKKQREDANFKAKPPSVLDKAPFLPLPSSKPLSHVDDFELHSDRRAVEREDFDRKLRYKAAEITAAKEREEEVKRQREEAEIAQARREAIHKAQPVKHYLPVHVHPSDKGLTTPMSPDLSYKEAGRKKQQPAPPNLDDTFDVQK